MSTDRRPALTHAVHDAISSAGQNFPTAMTKSFGNIFAAARANERGR
jgi:hypothetical protein